MQSFAPFPLLRLLMPFILGTWVYLYSDSQLNFFETFEHHVLFLILIPGILIGVLIVQMFYNIKFLISIIIDIIIFIFGYEISYYHEVHHHPDYLENKVKLNREINLIVKPVDVIVHKNGYNQLSCEMIRVFNFNKNKWENVIGKIILRIPDFINIDSIYHINAYYLITSKINKLVETKNPYAFDYAEYLKNQGVYYVVYLNKKSTIKFLGIKKMWNLKDGALYTRYKIIRYFKNNNYLNAIHKDLAIAFLTGFDDEMDKNIFQSFVYSGTLHILSVSGFHTGLLFLLISFIFSFIDPYQKWKWIRAVSIIFILFFYSFLAGFSEPVLRSSIMLSLIVVHQNFYTNRIIHPLNILSAAVFFILILNPLSINNTGFILSFSAMIGIIYFSPQYIFENRMIQNIWDIISMSIGAQLGTLPWALYFFHGFAFLFILANLLIIPLSTIIMFVVMASLIPLSFISIVLNALINLLIYLNDWSVFSKTYYDWIHFNFFDAIMLCVLIVGASILIQKVFDKELHWIKAFNFVILILSLWIVFHHLQYLHSYKKSHVFVYTGKDKIVCCIKSKNRTIFNVIDSSEMKYWKKNYLLKNCIDSYTMVPFNFVQRNNKKILICNQLSDTTLIKAVQAQIVIWNNEKILSNNLLCYPELEKIYWIKKSKNEQHFNNKVKLIAYKEWLEF